MQDELANTPAQPLAEVFAEPTELKANDTSTSSSSSEADATDDEVD